MAEKRICLYKQKKFYFVVNRFSLDVHQSVYARGYLQRSMQWDDRFENMLQFVCNK